MESLLDYLAQFTDDPTTMRILIIAVAATAVGILGVVAVPAGVPHEDLIILFYLLAANLNVVVGCSPHVGQRRLPTNHLCHHLRDQVWVRFKFGEFIGKLIQGIHAARHGVSGSVVTADNQQQ